MSSARAGRRRGRARRRLLTIGQVVAALLTAVAVLCSPAAFADPDDSGGNSSGDGGNADTATGADQNAVTAAMAAPLRAIDSIAYTNTRPLDR